MTAPLDGWVLPVRDAAGRAKELVVKVVDGEMWLVAPAPGAARLHGAEIQRLIDLEVAARTVLFEQDAP